MLPYPAEVTIVEVGPRDGLQNEAGSVPTEAKVALIDRLSASGLRRIEVTAFVSPKAIPQLADAEEVCARIHREPGVVYSALVPNERGYDRAAGAGLGEVAVFLSASESHNRANIGCSIAEAFDRFEPVLRRAEADGIGVRGYVSTAFGCPYEGAVEIARVVEIARRLLDAGCRQISLGDTVGLGNPRQVAATVAALAEHTPRETIALHLHDTRGTGLANALAGLAEGVTTFDSSVAGLGGCPYAPGAAGNLATDELVYMLDEMGVRTGVSLDAILAAGEEAAAVIGRAPRSRVLEATRATERRAKEKAHG